MERKGATAMKGRPLTLIGPELKPGDMAPDFICLDTKLNEVRLSDSQGRIRLIASVPSLDTSVCNKETVRFNDEADRLESDRVAWYTVSMDLPFAQKRFIEDEEVQNINILSDYRDASFGQAYGVLIKEMRLLSRAVFVIDEKGVIRYAEYLKENNEFPNFSAAMKVVRELAGISPKAAAA